MSTVSRRGVLAGAVGGALALAGCGPEGPGRRSGALRSQHWPGHEVRWEVALPGGRGAPGPLVVVLHGKGGTASSAFDALHLDDHVTATGLAIASVDGGDGYWHARRTGVDPGAMVVDDFLPLVRRLTGYRGRVAFLGWSMGGYGSLLLASQLGPEVVGAVVAESAALWTAPGASASGAFDDREDYDAHDVFARTATLSQIPVRLDCGRDDRFVTANRAFAKALPSAELTVDAGGHTTSYWRVHARRQLEWISAAL
jgi:pimeloyl-ACP methyl ester carboxylesterase